MDHRERWTRQPRVLGPAQRWPRRRPTLDDLFAWTATAMGTTLLPTDLGEQRLMLNTDLTDEQLTYGLGIMAIPLLPGWIGHSGQISGWTTIGLYNTETGAVFVAMSNGISGLESAVEAWANELAIG